MYTRVYFFNVVDVIRRASQERARKFSRSVNAGKAEENKVVESYESKDIRVIIIC